jgi:hypothetical protein
MHPAWYRARVPFVRSFTSLFLCFSLIHFINRRDLLVKDSKARQSASAKSSDLREKWLAFDRDLEAWNTVRDTYIPAAAISEREASVSSRSTYNHRHVWLPSAIPSARLNTCLRNVPNIERRIREAQCAESIAKLCVTRRLRANLWMLFKKHVAGDGGAPTTRARSVVNTIEAQCLRHVASYRAAWAALQKLDPHGDWQRSWLKLEDHDIRGPTLESDQVEVDIRSRQSKKRAAKSNFTGPDSSQTGRTMGTYQQSWIWTRQGVSLNENNPRYHEQARTEWARAQARDECWEEETFLLVEEMRRTLVSLRYRADHWLSRIDLRWIASDKAIDPALRDGLTCYARDQADIQQRLARQFIAAWEPLLSPRSIGVNWLAEARRWCNSAEEDKGSDEIVNAGFSASVSRSVQMPVAKISQSSPNNDTVIDKINGYDDSSASDTQSSGESEVFSRAGGSDASASDFDDDDD